MRALEQLVEQRRTLVDEVRRITNRLSSALKEYFPAGCSDDSRTTTRSCPATWWARWPTLKQAQRGHKARLCAFLREHNVRYPNIIERCLPHLRGCGDA